MARSTAHSPTLGPTIPRRTYTRRPLSLGNSCADRRSSDLARKYFPHLVFGSCDRWFYTPDRPRGPQPVVVPIPLWQPTSPAMRQSRQSTGSSRDITVIVRANSFRCVSGTSDMGHRCTRCLSPHGCVGAILDSRGCTFSARSPAARGSTKISSAAARRGFVSFDYTPRTGADTRPSIIMAPIIPHAVRVSRSRNRHHTRLAALRDCPLIPARTS